MVDAHEGVGPYYATRLGHLHPALILLQQLHIAMAAAHRHIEQFRSDPYVLCFGTLHKRSHRAGKLKQRQHFCFHSEFVIFRCYFIDYHNTAHIVGSRPVATAYWRQL